MIGKKSKRNLILNTAVSKKLGKLFWGGFSKICLGKKVFHQYGRREFLFCGYVGWFSKAKTFLLTITVVQIRVNS